MGNILRLGGSKGRKIRQRENLNCDAVSTKASAKSWSWGGPALLARHGQPFFFFCLDQSLNVSCPGKNHKPSRQLHCAENSFWEAIFESSRSNTPGTGKRVPQP